MKGETGAAAPSTPESLRQTVISLLQRARDTLGDLLALIALEARLAGLSLAIIVGLGVAAALLLCSVWFLILAAAVASLIAAGWAWGAALLLIAVCNLAMGAVAVISIGRYSRNLLFAKTRRQLFGARGSDDA